MDVSLTPELEELVRAKVLSGRYSSVNEVVCEALRLLEVSQSFEITHLKELRSRIDEGLTALDGGEGIDGESFMTGLLAGIELKEAQR